MAFSLWHRSQEKTVFLWRNLHRLKRSSPHPNKLVKGFFLEMVKWLSCFCTVSLGKKRSCGGKRNILKVLFWGFFFLFLVIKTSFVPFKVWACFSFLLIPSHSRKWVNNSSEGTANLSKVKSMTNLKLNSSFLSSSVREFCKKNS